MKISCLLSWLIETTNSYSHPGWWNPNLSETKTRTTTITTSTYYNYGFNNNHNFYNNNHHNYYNNPQLPHRLQLQTWLQLQLILLLASLTVYDVNLLCQIISPVDQIFPWYAPLTLPTFLLLKNHLTSDAFCKQVPDKSKFLKFCEIKNKNIWWLIRMPCDVLMMWHHVTNCYVTSNSIFQSSFLGRFMQKLVISCFQPLWPKCPSVLET